MKKILGLISLACAFLCSGCAAAGWLASLTPPAKIPAEYTIEEDQTALVLVEDPENIVNYSPVKYELARSVSRLLKKHDVVKKVVPPDAVLHLQSSEPNYRHLSTADIGRRLDADVVIYVRLTDFKLKDSEFSSIWLGKMGAMVKVISVKDGRLWPKESLEGHQVDDVVTKRHESYEKNYAEKLSRKMAEEMAGNIAQLFYSHPGQEHSELPKKDILTIDNP